VIIQFCGSYIASWDLWIGIVLLATVTSLAELFADASSCLCFDVPEIAPATTEDDHEEAPECIASK
jgi:hypothetical protein